MTNRVSLAFFVTLIVHRCCMEVTVTGVDVEVIQRSRNLQAILLFQGGVGLHQANQNFGCLGAKIQSPLALERFEEILRDVA